jgi:hypothetical protein
MYSLRNLAKRKSLRAFDMFSEDVDGDKLTEKGEEGEVNRLIVTLSLVLDKTGTVLHHLAYLITTLYIILSNHKSMVVKDKYGYFSYLLG